MLSLGTSLVSVCVKYTVKLMQSWAKQICWLDSDFINTRITIVKLDTDNVSLLYTTHI